MEVKREWLRAGGSSSTGVHHNALPVMTIGFITSQKHNTQKLSTLASTAINHQLYTCYAESDKIPESLNLDILNLHPAP